MTFKKGDIIYLRNPQTMLCPTGYYSMMETGIRNSNPVVRPDLYDKLHIITHSYNEGNDIEILNKDHNYNNLSPSFNYQTIRTSTTMPFPVANVFGLLDRPQDLHYEQLLVTKISKRNLSWKTFKKLARQSDI